jgi:hypothetical protein
MSNCKVRDLATGKPEEEMKMAPGQNPQRILGRAGFEEKPGYRNATHRASVQEYRNRARAGLVQAAGGALAASKNEAAEDGSIARDHTAGIWRRDLAPLAPAYDCSVVIFHS